ncbi:MAG: cation transporter [Deltaproteobacteria bacterium RIFOXYD12_FULL_57_12]|nr:MAG: cation transporter [Deltaproteobacteria bacterium RIFOXYD12_FULL_57_12]
MHIHTLHRWKHEHNFHVDSGHGERRTRQVIWLTVTTMVAEIVAGFIFGSMALLADGWHMGTHGVALGITVFAYRHARRHAANPLYSFGTGKVGVLGGFTSAVLLGGVALFMVVESTQRLIQPVAIRFNEAIAVAVIGLAVNVLSVLLLEGGGHGHHGHHDHDDHDHAPGNGHRHDHNLRAAYLHVLADALTSVLAIVALAAGKGFGWVWLDPFMGLVGAGLIARWSHGLLRDTGRILLDSGMSQERLAAIRAAIETDADNRVADLHVWPLGSHDFAAIISIVTHRPRPPGYYKKLLAAFHELNHITVEVHACDGESCLPTG